MSSLYQVKFYDPFGTYRYLLPTYGSLSFSQRVNSPWNHHVGLTASTSAETTEFFREELDEDWFVQVERIDDKTEELDIVYTGLNLTVVDQMPLKEIVLFNLYGVGLTELLSRRIVDPPLGLVNSDKVGIAETIMKRFVADVCIEPLDPDRKIPGLTNQVNRYQGKVASYSSRYINLLTIIRRIAEKGEVDFGIVESPYAINQFEFAVRSLWGEDKRKDNPDSRKPVVFSPEYNNMEIPIYSRNYSEARNFFWVAGQNQGIERDIITGMDKVAIANSPYARREDFVDARQESSEEGLQTALAEALQKRKARKTLTFNTRQHDTSRWLTHWGLGDLITALYGGQRFDKKIDQVNVTVSASSGQTEGDLIEVISAEFVDVPHPPVEF